MDFNSHGGHTIHGRSFQKVWASLCCKEGEAVKERYYHHTCGLVKIYDIFFFIVSVDFLYYQLKEINPSHSITKDSPSSCNTCAYIFESQSFDVCSCFIHIFTVSSITLAHTQSHINLFSVEIFRF